MKSYLWNISVYSDESKTPTESLEIQGSSVDVRKYAKRLKGDHFEAVPKPIECVNNKNCQYDHLFFATMKIGGELPQALVD